ncbi:MAG TPA: dihydrodipicolinate synthase family protein [Bacillota bacterium]|nr:dihydrodipicolinate synthase family protein [Bacillota bacterium]
MAAMDVDGIFIPVATPFDEAGEVDWDALRRNMQGWAAAPLKGYLALGSTSEFPSLDRAEKERVLTTIVEEAAGRTVIVQTGEQSTRATIEWTKRAAELGGQAALVVSPYYYKGLMSDKALQGFYEQVADASPIPTLIYNIPQNTGLNVPASLVCRLAEHENIVGIKDSSGNYTQLLDIIAGTPDDWGVTTGSSSLVTAALVSGAKGAILAAANPMPFEYCDIHRLVRAGDVDGAAEQQRRLQPIGGLLSKYGIPGTKAAMDLLGYAGRLPRAPMLPCGEAARDEILNALRAAQLVRF